MLRVLALALALAFGTANALEQPNTKPNKEPTNQAITSNQNTANEHSPRITVQTNEKATSNYKSAGNKIQNSRFSGMSNSSWWQNWLTKLEEDPIELFTLILAASTIMLWLETRSAARRSEEFSKTTMIEVRRAKIVFGGIQHEIRPDPSDNTKPQYRFMLSWYNSGETRTKDMLSYASFHISDTPIDDNFPFIINLSDGGQFWIGAKMSGTNAAIPIRGVSAEDMVKNFNGTIFMYIWGWSKYNDIFDGTPSRISKFCVQVICNGNPVNPGKNLTGVDFVYPFRTKHNCADEEYLSA